jgi:NAD(P)-dependent dehydrogenase (short-subunit alcohol dehydrogenase family)
MAHERPKDPRTAHKTPPQPAQDQAADRPAHESRMEQRPDFGERTYRGHGRLVGRVALITGADSGIGRAVALAFAREGADVAIAYLEEHEDAKETERWVKDAGRRATLLAGDVGVPKVCEEWVRRTVETLGGLHILVNNAAFQDESVDEFTAISPERVQRTFRTNIEGMFFLTRAALPHLKPGAVIINTTSIQAYKPSPGILDYATTKGAIRTFTQGLAQELTPKGIRVNAVAPGPVWTPLIQQSFSPDRVKNFGEDSPFKRPAQPAEVAPAYVFLASEDGQYVSGEILGVTGGKPLA